MNRFNLIAALSVLAIFALGGCTKSCSKEPAQPAKRVFFISPQEGQTVATTFVVKFGLEGMKIRPAGEDVLDKTSGHHHLFIDDKVGYIELGQASPKDETHIHYGKGETETTLTLAPGKHTLSLQFADGAHLSYGKEMSQTITITVAAPGNP